MPDEIPTPNPDPAFTPPALEPMPIFFGGEGLRAGWALLVYGLLLALLLPLADGIAAHLTPIAPLPPPGVERILLPLPTLTFEWLEAAAVLICTLLMAMLEGRPVAGFGLSTRRLTPRLLAGAAAGLALLSMLVGLLAGSHLLTLDRGNIAAFAPVRSGVLWLAALLGVALFEETCFRGYVQVTLTRGIAALYRFAGARSPERLGFWTAALLTSAAFGLVHVGNSGESAIGILAAALMGLALCLSLWRSGSLWWAIGFHAAWDWAESFLYGVPDSGAVSQGRLLTSHPVGPSLLSGGPTGPEGSLFVLPTLLLMWLVVLLTLPPRAPATVDAPQTTSM